MITAIAIDDEPMPLNILKGYAAQNPHIELVRTFTSTALAYQWLQENQVDLLFMDINMPAISGLDFVKVLKEQHMVIFCTAHAEHAVEGFDLNAIDYLLKPFAQERFDRAIDKAREYHEFQQERNSDEIFVKSDYTLVKIRLAEVLFIEAYTDYLKIHREEKQTIITRMTMKEMEEQLPKYFLRIHRSYIVPIDKVNELRTRQVVVGGHVLAIGKTFFGKVKKELAKLKAGS